MSEGRPDREARFDVVGIGNALVDVLTHVDDSFLDAHGLTKGAMALVEEDRALQLYGDMAPAIESSGGSGANTIAGVASLGGDAAYIGRVSDDQLGTVFSHDIRAAGVTFEVPPATSGPPTGYCQVLVTPDAQRTMNTYLGASVELAPGDVDGELIASGAVTFCEGYLWDAPGAKAAMAKGMDAARDGGRKVAFSLSDPFCVDRHREDFSDLVANRVDILFANEDEICMLYEVDDVDNAIDQVWDQCELVCLTRSERGSTLLTGHEVINVPAHPAHHVIDTTGAGDLYAAGVLYGLTRGHDLETCGRLGSMAAAEIISHLGARPELPLTDLAQRELSLDLT